MSSEFHSGKRRAISIIAAAVLISVLLLTATACVDPFEYRASRISPHDYPGSEWQSDDPYIYFHVKENTELEGYILLGEEKITIGGSIEWGRFVLIHKHVLNNVKESDYLLEGVCDCTEQQIVIEVRKDYCFDGQYETIVLNRIDEPESTEEG